MRFLADECCDTSLVDALRAEGHDVLSVMESLRGEVDTSILSLAYEEKRILITEDKDFGELVHRMRMPAHGIILLRFNTHERPSKTPRLLALLQDVGQRLTGAFVVLEYDKTRMRPLRG